MKWLLNTVSSFFVNPEAYITQCRSNFQKLNKELIYKFGTTSVAVGTGSGLATYIASGLISSADPNLGVITGATVGTIYFANKLHSLE